MNNTWLNKNSGKLFKVLSFIDNAKDMANFCRDLMTEAEIAALAGRWEVAQLLANGLSQRDISEKTGVSIATVTRVNQWLNRGMDGYKKSIDLLNRKDANLKSHSHTNED